MHKELAALIAQAKGQTDQAIALLKEAAAIEESMRPPNGAADPIKPSHELLGEVLLQAGKAKDAADAFEASLLRMPNRARSLMGAAKAHAAAGNKEKAAERLRDVEQLLERQAVQQSDDRRALGAGQQANQAIEGAVQPRLRVLSDGAFRRPHRQIQSNHAPGSHRE